MRLKNTKKDAKEHDMNCFSGNGGQKLSAFDILWRALLSVVVFAAAIAVYFLEGNFFVSALSG